MPKSFIIYLHFCFFLGFCSSLQAQETLNQAREDVAILCSDSLEGRGYINEGHIKAAAYISNRFREIGLKPIYQNGSYSQAFRFGINLVRSADLALNGKELEDAKDYIAYRLTGSGNGNLPIKDLGYGLKDKGDIQNKVVVFRDGWPAKWKTITKKQEKYKDRKQAVQRIEAIKKGHPALILVAKEKLTAGFGPEQVNIPILEVRSDLLPKKLKGAADFKVQAKQELIQSQNVIGYLPGTAYPDSVIIVSAHYDHLGRLGDGIFPGANDNASGTSMLLSMATYFQENPLKYSILFIAFGAEETGLNGSRYYVEAEPVVPLANTKFILNLDLMGNGDEGIMAVGGKDFPWHFDQLVATNDDLEAVPIVRSRKNAPNSDHYFFLVNGVPGFFIYTMGGPPHYHDVNDTPENLLFSKFGEVRELLIRFLDKIGREL